MTLIPSRGYDEGIRFYDLLNSQKGELEMTKVHSTFNLVLKVVAIGMAISSFILVALDVASLETSVMLLSIGLLALALAYLSETE